LIVADRIDAIYQQLKSDGLDNQFHRATRAWCRRITSSRFNSSAARSRPDLHPFLYPNATRSADLHEIGAATFPHWPGDY
jgi:hypothetical protein